MSTLTHTAALDHDHAYAAELAAARLAALRALTDILKTSDNDAEKRRIATIVLKLPQPDPEPRKVYCAEPPPAPYTYADLIAAREKRLATEASLQAGNKAPAAALPQTNAPNQPAHIPARPLPLSGPARLTSVCGTDQPTGPPRS
jgi:hypothetical protein